MLTKFLFNRYTRTKFCTRTLVPSKPVIQIPTIYSANSFTTKQKQRAQIHTSVRDKYESTTAAEIRARIILLKQISGHVMLRYNRLQAIVRLERVSDEQSVLIRHRSVTARAIHRNANPPSVRDSVRIVGVGPRQRRHRRKPGIVRDDSLVGIAGGNVVIKGVAEKLVGAES